VQQGVVVGAEQLGLDLGETAPLRLAALDGDELGDVARAVQGGAPAHPGRPVEQADRGVPPNGPPVGHLADATVRRARVVGRAERIRHPGDQFVESPLRRHAQTITLSH
jgi:hypothetical protein